MPTRLLGTSALLLVTALELCACSGSGGGGGIAPISSAPAAPAPSPTPAPAPAPVPAPSPAPAIDYNTAEFQRSAYAVDANAIAAYNAGATGQGIKIGIVDSGLNPALPEFAGRIDPASGDVAASRGLGDDGGHGTAVTAVAAAARDNQNTMGVAFNATIVSERADQAGSCSQTSGCQFYDSAIAAGIDAARTAGARVINLSLGGASPGTTVVSAMQRAVNAGIVLVISAGNDGTDPTKGVNPDPFALVPAQTFAGSVIIAGSIGAASSSGGTDINTISDFSNRAGSGAAYYLAALGYHDQAPDRTGAQFLWTGTSFSAPTISGAVALMAQAFPNLSGKQIVSILFQTADDLGAPGIDPVYGNGRLNIQRAFAPIGPTSIAGSQVPVAASDLPVSAGDAATGKSLGAIILDGYSRAYAMNLAATLRKADVAHPLSRALQNDVRVSNDQVGPLGLAVTVSERHDLVDGFAIDRLGIGPDDLRRSKLIAGSALASLDSQTAIAFGFAEGAKAMERRLSGKSAGAFLIANDIAETPGFTSQRNGSVAMRRKFGRMGVTFAGESGNVWQEIKTSASGSPYRFGSISLDAAAGRTWFSVGASRLDEKQSLLGGRLAAVLGGGGSSTSFLDLEVRHDLGRGWTGRLTVRHGWTAFSTGKLESGAYAIDLSKRRLLLDDDSLGFRIAQPLRVERGGLAVMLPNSWNYLAQSTTETLTSMSLSPRGREIDGELSYGANILRGFGWVGGNLYFRREPGHIASAPNDLGAAMRFSLGF